MPLRDKALYHQVHPLKLGTDICAQIVSLYFFWGHNIALGLSVMFLPPIVASLALVNIADFTSIKHSALGYYLKRYMTPAMEAVRLAGTIPMVLGAWFHVWWLIPLGLVITLFGWTRGLLFPLPAPEDTDDSRQ
jgi:hypothetical protein